MTQKSNLVSWLPNSRNLKKVMKLFILLMMLGSTLPFAIAGDLQQKKVSGKITDANGTALAGVNVLEKGTLNGAISDQNGVYTVNLSTANSILTFSFIGYSTMEVPVGTQSVVDIILKEALSALDEIVVVGYSTQAKEISYRCRFDC